MSALLSLNSYDTFTLAICVLLILFVKPLLKFIDSGSDNGNKPHHDARLLVAINIIVIVLILGQALLDGERVGWIKRSVNVLWVIYIAQLAILMISSAIRLRYGKKSNLRPDTTIDTYSSRALSISASVLVIIIALILIVRILGYDSLLQAGGILGFIGVLLALTQAAWAPDIISGLIMLNACQVQEGDIIEVHDGKDTITATVFRTKTFHTELLGHVNNHRIMLRNANLRDTWIHNLSRFASAKGLREQLTFNIGYDISPAKVREMFEAAWQNILEEQVPVESQHQPLIRVLDTGDYAVKWAFMYHTKEVQRILSTRQAVFEAIWSSAEQYNIALSTPLLVNAGTLATAPQR